MPTKQSGLQKGSEERHAINTIGLTENENKTEKPIDKQEEMRYNTNEDE